MKWWLIVFVVTQDGITLFDVEYNSWTECQAALAKTAEITEGKDEHERAMMVCRRFPLPLLQPENPEIEV